MPDAREEKCNQAETESKVTEEWVVSHKPGCCYDSQSRSNGAAVLMQWNRQPGYKAQV